MISENNKESNLVNWNVQTESMNKNQSSQFITPAGKRPLSTTSNSTENNGSSAVPGQSQNPIEKKNNSATKKFKKDLQDIVTNDSVKLHLEPAREFIDNSIQNSHLTFDDLSEFLVKTFGKKNIPEIAADYTQDISTLTTMLEGIASKLTDKNLKSRVLRIKKRLMNIDLSDSQCEISTTESIEMNV